MNRITTTFAVFHNGEEYTCQQNNNDVKIVDEVNEHVGTIPNQVIPHDSEELEVFEYEVKLFLESLGK